MTTTKTKLKVAVFGDLKAIDAGIRKLRGLSANVNNLIQGLAVAILQHDKDHGDCSRALDLVNAIPNSFRRDMLVRWFAYYGNIGMDVKSGKPAKHIAKDAKAYRDVPYDKRLNEAKVNPWFDEASVPGQPPLVLPITLGSINEEIINFADRLRKRIESGGTEKRPMKMSDEEKRTALKQLSELEEISRKVAPPPLREKAVTGDEVKAKAA